jgi:hypothetical protein
MSTVASTFTGLAALSALAVYVRDVRDGVRARSNRVARRGNASVVATDVSRSAAPAEFLSTYLTSVHFTHGDAWEVMR